MNAVIQFEGTIYEQGYGLIAQQVMRDSTLPKQSKLIYSYMCSFAGASQDGERTAFPSISLQLKELGMTRDTYYKWRKYLIDRGLLKITKQRKEGAKFERNIYSIIAVPKPEPINSVSEEKKDSEQNSDENPDTEGNSPWSNFSTTEKSTTENSTTNSNSLNSNSLKRNTDTRDTRETKSVSSSSSQIISSGEVQTHHEPKGGISTAKKGQDDQEELLKESLRKNSGLSDRTFKLLSGFSESYEQMYNWIGIFYRAKKKAEENMNEVIIMEYEMNEEMIYTSLLSVIRIIRTQEKENPDNYMFISLKNAFEEELTIRARQKKKDDNANHWLNG
ncbi:helix-turn-helix domain-containing protein [Alkalicoccus luteus]|uniref:Helix-turn-helix domain-containing protein n=1 Tax=Alkalicoccus luteus TaxID=1237094 RepID=A0A969PV70_9BACI|nr:helix-turn-helix domain-containing protein [Alkalicoccus luteus]NJP38971.1 helix-turn-helix domain-containing protein [Alkalicoccus luteus]